MIDMQVELSEIVKEHTRAYSSGWRCAGGNASFHTAWARGGPPNDPPNAHVRFRTTRSAPRHRPLPQGLPKSRGGLASPARPAKGPSRTRAAETVNTCVVSR
eukprot:6424722-Prymnesium_polylepis.1